MKSVKMSLFLMPITILMLSVLLVSLSNKTMSIQKSALDLFSGNVMYFMLLFSMFMCISSMNLLSLNFASFPSTTVLFFNFSVALMAWFSSVLFLLMKNCSFSTFTPSQAPWYLIFFLSLIEMISFLVRPLTLCFRLLANMSAGHILLALSTKLGKGLWLAGMTFGLLELVICIVQGYVFILLVKVYVEEYQ